MRPPPPPHRKFAVFDLDGCISDDSRRLPLIRPDHDFDKYDKYHEDMEADPLVNLKALNGAVERGNGLLFVTARPEKYRNATESWLRSFGIAASHLLMRPNGDMRGSPQLKCELVEAWLSDNRDAMITEAYDDRLDILAAYHELLPTALVFQLTVPGVAERGGWDVKLHGNQADNAATEVHAYQVLEEMAATFKQRNAVYGSNFKMVGPIMALLFPNGVSVELLKSDQFHLFELLIVKLSRLAISGLKHQDSARDAGVYAAMIESIITNQGASK